MFCFFVFFVFNVYRIMDISPFDDFIGLDWASQFSYQSNQLYTNGFNLPNLDQSSFEVDQNPLNVVLPDKGKSGFVEASVKTGNQFASEGENQELPLLPLPSSSSSTNITRKRSSSLQFDDIRKHFDVPLTMAAKKMNVSVTLLKKRCRELKITRWPHRKLRSLNVLINSLKVFFFVWITHFYLYLKLKMAIILSLAISTTHDTSTFRRVELVFDMHWCPTLV